MTRPVVWATEATRDALDILRHIPQDDPDVAERIVGLIEAAGTRLGKISTGRPGRVADTFENPSRRFRESFVMPSTTNQTRSALSSSGSSTRRETGREAVGHSRARRPCLAALNAFTTRDQGVPPALQEPPLRLAG